MFPLYRIIRACNPRVNRCSLRDSRAARPENDILQPHPLRGHGSTKKVHWSGMVSNAKVPEFPIENRFYILRGQELASSNCWKISVTNEAGCWDSFGWHSVENLFGWRIESPGKSGGGDRYGGQRLRDLPESFAEVRVGRVRLQEQQLIAAAKGALIDCALQSRERLVWMSPCERRTCDGTKTRYRYSPL